MSRILLATAMLGILAAGVLADYPAERKAAAELVKGGKNAEAMEAFLALAGGEITEQQKTDALEQAAYCALRLKQYDRALEIARQIPIRPASILMQIEVMGSQRKWAEVIKEFKDEDIDAWPDGYKGNGFYQRGLSAYYMKNSAMAEADLKKAVTIITEGNSLGLAWNALGDTYRDLLKDNAKAIEAYRETYKTNNPYKRAKAAISVAGLLSQETQHDEAIQELQKIDMAQMQLPVWRVQMLLAYGHTYAAAGRKAEAIEKYREGTQVEGVPAYFTTACEKALKKLEGEDQ